MKLLFGWVLALVLSFTAVTAFTSATPVYAWNPFGNVCKDAGSGGDDTDPGNSAVCVDQAKDDGTNPLTGTDGLILNIANVVAFVAGAAAVIIIILAGLRMVTSSGGSEDIAGARRTLIYAIVGLIVIALARIIIGFIISAL